MTQRDPRDASRSGAASAQGSGWAGSPARRDPEPRRGPHIGPIRITPVRVTLLVALVGGIAFLLYSTFIRDQLQVPLMATGFAICGLVFAAVAILSVMSVVQAGREGRDGRAVLSALFGGVVAVGALMFLSAAMIMGMIWSGTRSS
jgi:drug/metabolite transporter (DMT)-like permease